MLQLQGGHFHIFPVTPMSYVHENSTQFPFSFLELECFQDIMTLVVDDRPLCFVTLIRWHDLGSRERIHFLDTIGILAMMKV
jgi:hypothetical protein